MDEWIATHNVIVWITGLVGAIGVAGAILLAVFAPPALLLIWRGIAGFVSWFWSTRLGVAVMVGAAMFYGTSWYQHHVDSLRCQAQKGAMVDAAKAKAKARDNAIDAGTTIYVNQQLKQEAQAASVDALKESAYVKTLAGKPACLVGDDADSLRALVGQPPLQRSQRADHAAMPAAATQKDHARH